MLVIVASSKRKLAVLHIVAGKCYFMNIRVSVVYNICKSKGSGTINICSWELGSVLDHQLKLNTCLTFQSGTVLSLFRFFTSIYQPGCSISLQHHIVLILPPFHCATSKISRHFSMCIKLHCIFRTMVDIQLLHLCYLWNISYSFLILFHPLLS